MKSCPSCHSTYPTDFLLCPRDGTSLVESAAWREGTLVRGKYRILALLGGGGMATVYKALHMRFDEVRALKVMLPELANDPNLVKRFAQEAVLTRKLQHPNAVHVEDIDEAEDGRPFIVMEYIHGRSLQSVIKQESPMPVERVCAVVKQVASALDAAHGLGIVHRDVKPGNIVLLHKVPGTTNGNSVTSEVSLKPVHRAMAQHLPERHSHHYPLAKVLDFGIARIKEVRFEDPQRRHQTLTGAGMVVGTPAYMSPEQAAGKRGAELDGRSDLYSLAVVMYQMLTGELPLKADSEMALMLAHIQAAPVDIRTRRPDLPGSLARLVMRCLEKNPDDRPPSGKVLIKEIEFWEQESARLDAARRQAEEEQRRAEAEWKAREEVEVRERAKEASRKAAEAEEARRAEAGRRARERERAEAERRAQEAEARRRAQVGAEVLRRAEKERTAREAEETGARNRAEEDTQRRSQAALRALRASAEGKEQAADRAGGAAAAHAQPAGFNHTRRSKVMAIGIGIAAVLVIGLALSAYIIRLHRAAAVSVENAGAASPTAGEAQTPQTPAATAQEAITPAAPEGSERTPPGTPAPPRADQIRELLLRGDVYYEKAQYDAAIGQYQRASALDPTNSELITKIQQARRAKQVVGLISRGDSYYQSGDYDTAIGEYQKARSLDPNAPELPVKIKKAQTAKDTEKALSIH